MRFIRTLLSSWKGLPPRTHLLIAGGALVILIAFGVFLYTRPVATPVERETFEDPALPVTLSTSYEEGVHTSEGTATLRNRCQRLNAIASLDDTEAPALIRIDITSEHDEGICLEIPDTRTFTLEVEGPEDARTEVFVNGIPQGGGDAL